MAEKTEKATPKKLRDARKKGQVAKSQDFPSAFTFVVSIAGTIFAAKHIYENTGGFIISIFSLAGHKGDMQNQLPALFDTAMQVIIMTSAPILVITLFVGILANLLVVGPVFSFETMKFNLKKLNPVEGIKQKFKLKTLVELLKSLAKIIGAAIIIYMVMVKMIPEAIATAAMPVIGSAQVLADFLTKVIVRVGIFFLFVAFFDIAFQKRTFRKEMMMEKFEVKQEFKDTEGDPQIKNKRRERFREIAYQGGPSSVKNASAIITNPTHIAVAIGYEEEEEPAPTILAMGKGVIAEKIIEAAIGFQVPVMRNPELAQTLFARGDVGDFIPPETYEAIAEILKWIQSLEKEPEEEVMEFFQ
jgi:type III secretion protein U